MDAKSRAFTFLGNEALIRVPFFQRAYVWKKRNWEDLLSELSNLSKTHFLGSIILKQQPVATGETKEVLIIDGQQRLTTLSILVKALYDSFPKATRVNVELPIRSYLFYKKEQTDPEFLIKIQHSQIDAVAYDAVMRAGIDTDQPLEISDVSGSRILECYAFFLNTLNERSLQERIALFNWLTKMESEILVVIDLGLKDDEQAIFDTINSAGVYLSAGDIIKNALFQRVIQLEDHSSATKLYYSTWNKVISDDKKSIAFWEKQRSTGRLKRDNLEILLHAIAVIKGFYNPDEHTLSDLSKLYKDQIGQLNTKEELRNFIKDITEYAEIYKNKIPVFSDLTMFSFDNYHQRLFHILEYFEISTFHPFILYLYKTFGTDEVRIKNTFADLESFVLRRVISKHEVKSFNKFCKEFIENPAALLSRLAESNDIEFQNQLKVISNRHAALLLFWIELYRRSQDNKNDLKHLKYSYSLEHIMPQSWPEHWTTIPVKTKTDGSLMSKAESEADRNQKIYWIGNMTLLTTYLNSSLRHYSYDVKMNGMPRRKGIKVYADLTITKNDLVIPFDAGDTTWDEHKIIARTETLLKEIDAIWKKQIIEVTT